MRNRLSFVDNSVFLTDPRDLYIGKSLEIYGKWSYGEIELISQLINKNSSVVEVGSNIGAHTLFIARDLCPFGNVYAFEPRRLNFQMLYANIALNSIKNVFAYQLALSESFERIFEGSISGNKNHNIGAYPLGSVKGNSEIIDVITLDSIIDDIQSLSLIKADVEGYEYNVLLGAARTIKRDRPIIYVENDRPEKSTVLIQYIFSINYKIWWHIVPLYRKDNLAGTSVNIFGNTHSYNMICIPQEKSFDFPNLRQIKDPTYHPLAEYFKHT